MLGEAVDVSSLTLVMVVTGLAEQVGSPEGKVAVTLLAVLGAVLATWFARQAQTRLKGFASPAVADVVASMVVIGVFASAIAVIVELWGLSNEVLTEVQSFSLGSVIPQLIVTTLVVVGA